MATTIKLKNSVVKDKVPVAGDIQIGELCVGANSESPALFFKDNADNIIKIEPGAGAESSPTPPTDPGTGDLWFDTDNDTLNYWDGAAWVELGEAGDSPVKSVNTKTGAVVLDAADVGALAAGDNVSELTNDAAYITLAEVPSALVSSVNTQTGDVVLDAVDVGALPIVGGELTGPLTSTSTATFIGDVTADKFIGDGSLLTNLPVGPTGDYLPLTGGELTGPLTSTSTITAEGTFTVNNNGKFYRPASKGGDVAGNGLLTLVSDVNGIDSNAVSITTDGSITAAGDVAIGDSTTFFNLISDVVAALPEEIKEEFASVIATWNQASAYTDVSTLPADTPTPLRDAVVRATTAGKINLNADNGNITAAGSVFVGVWDPSIDSDGVTLDAKGTVFVQRPTTKPTNALFSGYLGTTETSRINANGSAVFNGPLTVLDNVKAPKFETSSYVSSGTGAYIDGISGDAAFTGTITAKGYSMASLTQLS